MSAILFFIGAIGTIAGAVGVVTLRDPFFAVLALVAHLISLAVLFLLLRAEFVAAAQVVVYAGAVMVLYVFVVAYVGGEGERIGERLRGPGPVGSSLRLGAVLVGGALVTELLIALLGTGLKAIDGDGAGYAPGPRAFGTPAYIGNLLLTRFLLAFEIASFLLLIAAVGAVVLARRRRGLGEDEQDRLTPLDVLRPQGTGTMAEGVSGLSFAVAHMTNGDGDGHDDADHAEGTAPAVGAAAGRRAETDSSGGEGGW